MRVRYSARHCGRPGCALRVAQWVSRSATRNSYYELPQVDNRRALVNAGLSGHEVGLIVATLDHSRPGEKPTHDGAQSGGFLYGVRAAMFPVRIADANSSSSSTMRGSVRMPAPTSPSTVSQFFVGGRSPGVTEPGLPTCFLPIRHALLGSRGGRIQPPSREVTQLQSELRCNSIINIHHRDVVYLQR